MLQSNYNITTFSRQYLEAPIICVLPNSFISSPFSSV